MLREPPKPVVTILPKKDEPEPEEPQPERLEVTKQDDQHEQKQGNEDPVNDQPILKLPGTATELVCFVEENTEKEKNIIIRCKKTTEEAKIPERQTEGAAGYDLHATETLKIKPSESTITNLGFQLEIPQGYMGWMTIRSSLAKIGALLLGGVIDWDYRGDLKAIIKNTHKINDLHIIKGDRFAQIIFIPVLTRPIEFIEGALGTTKRQDGGLGSTGANTVIVKKEITELEHAPKVEGIHTYKLGPQLTEAQKKQIKGLIERYKDVFATDFSQLK